MSAHPPAGVGASADPIDVIARDAYLFFLQQGHETLNNSLDLRKVEDREVEMVVDQALTDRYKPRGCIRAYRASASVVRTYYHCSKRDALRVRDGDAFRAPAPYHPYVRREPARRTEVSDGGSAEVQWAQSALLQRAPQDSVSHKLLPTHFSWNRAGVLTYVLGSVKTVINARDTPIAAREWSKTGLREVGVEWGGERRLYRWKQLAPVFQYGLDLETIWKSSREILVEIEVDLGSQIYKFVYSSQIARLPDGTYVPWKKSEEDYYENNTDYTDYNYTGPYDPRVRDFQRLQPSSIDTLELPPPPRINAPRTPNLSDRPPPPLGRVSIRGMLIDPNEQTAKPTARRSHYAPTSSGFLPHRHPTPHWPGQELGAPPLPPPPSQEWLDEGRGKKRRASNSAPESPSLRFYRPPHGPQSHQYALSHRQQVVYQQKEVLLHPRRF